LIQEIATRVKAEWLFCPQSNKVPALAEYAQEAINSGVDVQPLIAVGIGAVASIHRFGPSLNEHVHVHDGVDVTIQKSSG
jgi:hypothetical protein